MRRRYLGLDCATINVGWAVVDDSGGELTRVDSGVWNIAKAGKGMSARLVMFDRFLEQVMAKFAPSEMVVETAYVGRNAQSTLRISEVRGVALLHAGRGALRVNQVAPASLKKEIGGHGQAKKDVVADGVRGYFPDLTLTFSTDDESDAMALAVFGSILDRND